jgi:hypothetical protein
VLSGRRRPRAARTRPSTLSPAMAPTPARRTVPRPAGGELAQEAHARVAVLAQPAERSGGHGPRGPAEHLAAHRADPRGEAPGRDVPRRLPPSRGQGSATNTRPATQVDGQRRGRSVVDEGVAPTSWTTISGSTSASTTSAEPASPPTNSPPPATTNAAVAARPERAPSMSGTGAGGPRP